jgi:hypothetical protein
VNKYGLVFDSFTVDNNDNPDLTQNVGGVPSGIAIAEDTFNDEMKKAVTIDG